MKNLTIARRYAKALLLIGKEENKAEVYKEELDGFAGLMQNDPLLVKTIDNPLYESTGRRKVLSVIIDKLKMSPVMNSFLLLLFDKGRIGFLSDINEFYKKASDELKGIAHASVLSATELSSDVTEKIRAALSKKTGKDIRLEVKQDKNLIGGIVTKIGDFVLDGSIKTQLLNMKESLKRGESV